MKYTVANIFRSSAARGGRAMDRRAGDRQLGVQGLEGCETRPMH